MGFEKLRDKIFSVVGEARQQVLEVMPIWQSGWARRVNQSDVSAEIRSVLGQSRNGYHYRSETKSAPFGRVEASSWSPGHRTVEAASENAKADLAEKLKEPVEKQTQGQADAAFTGGRPAQTERSYAEQGIEPIWASGRVEAITLERQADGSWHSRKATERVVVGKSAKGWHVAIEGDTHQPAEWTRATPIKEAAFDRAKKTLMERIAVRKVSEKGASLDAMPHAERIALVRESSLEMHAAAAAGALIKPSGMSPRPPAAHTAKPEAKAQRGRPRSR